MGATEAPPWIVREGEGRGGIEAEILRAFAGELGARIEWVDGSESELAEALEKRRIDVLAGGLTHKAPWKKQGAPSLAIVQAGKERHVLFVAKGENRLLLELDRFIARRGRELALDARKP